MLAFRIIGLDEPLGHAQERMNIFTCLIHGLKYILKWYKNNVDKFVEKFEVISK